MMMTAESMLSKRPVLQRLYFFSLSYLCSITLALISTFTLAASIVIYVLQVGPTKSCKSTRTAFVSDLGAQGALVS